jgi:aryl-alcohol dehydrogenase-like predicted oxidoreductase
MLYNPAVQPTNGTCISLCQLWHESLENLDQARVPIGYYVYSLNMTILCGNTVLTFVYSLMLRGLLTGKFSKNQKQDPSSSRVAWVDHNPGERASQSHPSFENYSQSQGYWELMDALDLVAKKHEATQAQVAIAWLLQKPGVSSVIIGARTSQQLAENIHSAFVNLNFEEMQLLDEKSFIPPPYPYEMIERLNKSRKH